MVVSAKKRGGDKGERFGETLELPEGWGRASVLEVSSLIRGVSYKKGEATTSPGRGRVALFRANNISDQLTFSDLQYVPKGRVNDDQMLRQGDVMLATSSGSKSVVGKAASVGSDVDGAFGAFCGVLRPSAILDSRFFGLYFQTSGYRAAISEASTGTNINNLKREHFADLSIPLPPLAEQKRIVAKVEELLARVNPARERLARIPAILKRFRQSVLAAACSGRLTEEWRREHGDAVLSASLEVCAPSNDLPDAGEHLEGQEFPDSWTRCRTDAIVHIQNGRAFPSKEYQSEGIRLLRPGNLHISGRVEWNQDNTVCLPKSWVEEFPEYILRSGELVMNLTAQSLKDEFLGRVCLKTDDGPALLNQRIARFRIGCAFDVRPYLFIYFRSRFFRALVNGLDTGSLIRHMHSKDVARHVVPLPPPEEQTEIVRRVGSLLAVVDVLQERLAKATALVEGQPQAILAKAFRGELVPTEADLACGEDRACDPFALYSAAHAVTAGDAQTSKKGATRP